VCGCARRPGVGRCHCRCMDRCTIGYWAPPAPWSLADSARSVARATTAHVPLCTGRDDARSSRQTPNSTGPQHFLAGQHTKTSALRAAARQTQNAPQHADCRSRGHAQAEVPPRPRARRAQRSTFGSRSIQRHPRRCCSRRHDRRRLSSRRTTRSRHATRRREAQKQLYERCGPPPCTDAVP
jgi:hypothetical protein